MSLVRRVKRLSPSLLLLLASAVSLVAAMALALQVVAFPRLLAWAAARPSSERRQPSPTEDDWRLVDRLLRKVPGRACLARSLALMALAGRHGIRPALAIGIERSDGGLRAHAWLERHGLTWPISEGADFPVVLRVPSAP